MTSFSEESLLNLKAVSARTGDLPPIPAIALEALQVTKNPNITAKQLQSVIVRDQALSARILRIVNSAMYGLRREVSTISHAVAILGMETLRSILMAAAVQQVFHTGIRGQDLTAKLLSDHSWGAAIAARTLARKARHENIEEAFLCGLMHDIGKPVLQKNFSEQYVNVISEVYRGSSNFHDLEMNLFGFSHAHVGALLAQKWNFPVQLSVAIGFHHDPIQAPDHKKLACIISLADAAMIHLEIGIQKNKDLELAKEPAAVALNLDESSLNVLLEEIKAGIAQMPC